MLERANTRPFTTCTHTRKHSQEFQHSHHSNETPNTIPHLRDLNRASCKEVREVILSSPNTICDLDHIPTWPQKKCIDQQLQIITGIINSSISSGCFTDELKSAIIRPHLKKTNTDTDEQKNYRPVSNLHFIRKVLEKLVVKRLEQHIINHILYDPLQSAYIIAHSTETTIMKIHNDIVNGLDKDHCIILAFLDLSAAFDTVDHDIFIDRIRAYDIRETALKWFQ